LDTLLFLVVVVLLATLAVLAHAPDGVTQLLVLAAFGVAAWVVVKVEGWVVPAPLSCLLELSGDRVCLRVPRHEQRNAFEDHWFENRGLTLVSAQGEAVQLRLPEGKTLELARRYLPRTDLARTLYRGSAVDLSRAGAAWVLAINEGVLHLERAAA
jgi:hypothetical protein